VTGTGPLQSGARGPGWSHEAPRPRPGLFGRAARALGEARRIEPANLEPRGVGGLLDTALDVLRARFRACFGLAFAILLPLALLTRALRRDSGEALGTLLLEVAAHFLAQTLAVGLITHLVYAHLQGRRVSALESLGAAGRRGPALLALAVTAQIATTLGAMCCLIPGLVVAWLTAVAPAALVHEGLGPLAALSRSTALMRTSAQRWAGVMALQVLLVLPFTLAAGGLEQYATVQAFTSGPALVVIETVLRVALSSLATSFAAVVLTVLYIDTRVRAEGFDLVMRFERLARGAGA
jgi:hypothetical protein